MSYNLSVTGIINVTYLKTGNIIIGNEAIIYFIMSYSQSVPGNLLELGMALHQRYSHIETIIVELDRVLTITVNLSLQDCADRMLRGIPSRRLWYYVDWSSAFIGHFYSLFPEISDWFVRYYLSLTSHVFQS